MRTTDTEPATDSPRTVGVGVTANGSPPAGLRSAVTGSRFIAGDTGAGINRLEAAKRDQAKLEKEFAALSVDEILEQLDEPRLSAAMKEVARVKALYGQGLASRHDLETAGNALRRAKKDADASKRKAERATFNQAVASGNVGALDNVIDMTKLRAVPDRPGCYTHIDTGEVFSCKRLTPAEKVYPDGKVRVRHMLKRADGRKVNDYRARINLAAKLGHWNFETVDHRNGVTTDDTPDNLAAASSQRQAETRDFRKDA